MLRKLVRNGNFWISHLSISILDAFRMNIKPFGMISNDIPVLVVINLSKLEVYDFVNYL